MNADEMTEYQKYLNEKPLSELIEMSQAIDRINYADRYRAIRQAIETRQSQSPDPNRLRFSGEEIVQILEAREKQKFNATYLLVFSAMAFFLAGGLNSSFESVLSLGAVILIHEIGHLIAMKIFKYRHTSILFLPLIGGLAHGKPTEPNSKREAIVALMGPLFGLVGGCIFLWASHLTWLVTYDELARLSLIINLFNLLPFLPLDGGQILQSIIFNRSLVADVLFKMLGICGSLYLAYELQAILFVFIAVLLILQIRLSYFDKQVITSIKLEGKELGTTLNVITAQSLCDTIVEVEGLENKPNFKIKYVANRVEQIFHKFHKDSASVGTGILIFCAYLTTFLVGIALFVHFFPMAT